jgi:hypothetical protein
MKIKHDPSYFVIPAQAGIHALQHARISMDSGLRRDDVLQDAPHA